MRVRNGARIQFAADTTVMCKLLTGKAVHVAADGPATLVLPGKAKVRLGNLTHVDGECGQIRLIAESGVVRFGKAGEFNLDVCVVDAAGGLKLGNRNNLRGHFVSGGYLGSDKNNTGRCCDPGVTSSTTTTSSTTSTAPSTSSTITSTSSSSSSSSSSTSTSSTTTSSVTTSTDPGGSSTTSTSSTTTSSISTTTSTSYSTTSSSTSITTTSTSSSTTTTLSVAWTRTIGFYKTHPEITLGILTSAGGIGVCGTILTDVDLDDAHSAVEALCISPLGDLRLQLTRQLTAAALTMAAGGASFTEFAACNSICAAPASPSSGLADCITDTDVFNNSGDALAAPFDPPGAANPTPCQLATDSGCTVLDGSGCAVP